MPIPLQTQQRWKPPQYPAMHPSSAGVHPKTQKLSSLHPPLGICFPTKLLKSFESAKWQPPCETGCPSLNLPRDGDRLTATWRCAYLLRPAARAAASVLPHLSGRSACECPAEPTEPTRRRAAVLPSAAGGRKLFTVSSGVEKCREKCHAPAMKPRSIASALISITAFNKPRLACI